MKAIILARVSTEEQREAGNSLPSQILRLERYCLDKGFEVNKKIQFDESAWQAKRKEFSEIIDGLRKTKEKVALCCDKIDRLLRNFTKELIILEDLRKNDRLELHFPSDNIVLHKDSPAPDLFRFTMGVSLAKYYSDSISDNVKRAYEKMVRNGQILSRAPIGYINTRDAKDNKTVEIDPDKAEHIKKIFDLYSTGGFSMEKIAEIMHQDGFRSTAKNKIKLRQIEIILKNPFYYGYMNYKGSIYPHKYPKLVSYHIWNKCKEIMEGIHGTTSRHYEKPFIFRNLISCGRCGCMVTAEMHKDKYVYYRCTNSKKICSKVYVNQDELLKPIQEILQNLKLPRKIVEQVAEILLASENTKNKYHEMEVKRLKSELEKILRKQVAIYDDKYEQKISEEIFESLTREMEERKYNIRFKLSQYENANNNFFINANRIMSLCTRAYEIFENSEIAEKRELLKILFQNLKLDGKKLEYKLKTPFEEVFKATTTHKWGPLCEYFRTCVDLGQYLPVCFEEGKLLEIMECKGEVCYKIDT